MQKKHFSPRLSLKKKLVLGFSVTFCLVITGFGMLILKTNGTRYQQQSYDYCSKIVEANISLIDHYFEQLSNVTQIVATDRDIVNAVTYRENTAYVDYAVELYNQRRVADKIHQFDVLQDVENAIIVGSDGQYLYYSDRSPKRAYSFLEQDWFRQALPATGHVFLNYHATDYLLMPSRSMTVSLLAPIFTSDFYFAGEPAYLLCDFSLDPILQKTGGKNETQIAIYAGTAPVYFPADVGMSRAQLQQLNENLAAGRKAFLLDKGREGEHSYLVSAETSRISGWSILGILPMDSLQALTRSNTLFVLVLLGACIAVTWLLSNLIARSLLDPMNQLIEKFGAIGRGERNVTFEKTQSIEVDRIAETAMEMLRKNEELTIRNAQEGRQRAQASLRALQHQINPHFLGNVLQAMKALAVCGDTESVSKMATLLGKLLSYSVYSPYDMVPLRDEFDYVDTYIALQNVRFQNRLIYTPDLSPEAASFRTPKLIIQPLVENAVVHGLDISEGGQISVSAGLDEDTVCIAVTNNGKRIEPEKLEHLNRLLREGSADEQEKSIGLLNVRARLKGCYGENADLEILSRDGMSTSVVITIPVHEEDDKLC